MTLSKESLYLIFVGLLDLIHTTGGISSGKIAEVNPILKFYLDLSVPTFIIMKLLLLVGALIAFNHLVSRKPRMQKWSKNLLRLAIMLYITIYLAGAYLANSY